MSTEARRVTFGSSPRGEVSEQSDQFDDWDDQDDLDQESELVQTLKTQYSQEKINQEELCDEFFGDMGDEIFEKMEIPGEAAPNTEAEDEFDFDLDESELIRTAERAEQQAAAAPIRQQAQPESKRQCVEKKQGKSEKQSKSEKQGKITGYFPKGVSETIARASTHKDTSEQMYCGNRVYKKGDTWMSNKKANKTSNNKGDLTRYYFSISSMEINTKEKARKEAVCDGAGDVHIKLEETFIGAEQSQRITSEWKKKNRRDPDKAQCANPTFLPAGKVFLKNLTHRYTDGPRPQAELIYEQDKKGTFGEGFTCAYRYTQSKESPELRQKPVVLDLFAGCGGASQGFEDEGFRVAYKVENNPAAAATLAVNDQDAKVICECAELFLQKCRENKSSYYPELGVIIHIHASSPCQGYSMANRNGGANDAANNRLTFVIVEAIEYFRPWTASFENVLGMFVGEKIIFLKKLIADILLLDYQVRVCIVTASDFGDPQDRQRVILLAARKDCKLPDDLVRTHGIEGGPPRVTVEDVLRDLEDIAPVRGSGIVQKPDGLHVANHNSEGTREKEDPNNVDRLVRGECAKTVRRRRAIKHYSLPRCLTVRERARLQSFPDTFRFCGRLTEQVDQIGNANPVKLSRAIARSVMQSYNKNY